MKHYVGFILAGIMIVGSLTLTGCEKGDIVKDVNETPSAFPNREISEDMEIIGDLELTGDTELAGDTELTGDTGSAVMIKSKSIRTQYVDDNRAILCFTSADELERYYKNNKEKYDLDRARGTDSFATAISGYDDEYFRKNDLILVVITAGSGSVRYTALGVEYGSDPKGNKIYKPIIESKVPEVGTCDMANWHILIEVSKSYKTTEYEPGGIAAPAAAKKWYEKIGTRR